MASEERTQELIHGLYNAVVAMDEVGELEWQDALEPLADSPVYKSALEHIKHPACPVLVAIVKAIEVEVGVALPRDVVIRFETTNHS